MNELMDLKERMEHERPAQWHELPDIALYMDQIIAYMPRQLIRFDDREALTSAMVNNYIKDGLVPRAAGKRYGPIHLGYLTAVCALKKVLSVRDIGILLRAAEERNKTPEELYQYFCGALDQALSDTAAAIDADAGREDLARMALDLALRSYADQLACARILDILQPSGNIFITSIRFVLYFSHKKAAPSGLYRHGAGKKAGLRQVSSSSGA